MRENFRGREKALYRFASIRTEGPEFLLNFELCCNKICVYCPFEHKLSPKLKLIEIVLFVD